MYRLTLSMWGRSRAGHASTCVFCCTPLEDRVTTHYLVHPTLVMNLGDNRNAAITARDT